jgi:hypothetical protein
MSAGAYRCGCWAGGLPALSDDGTMVVVKEPRGASLAPPAVPMSLGQSVSPSAKQLRGAGLRAAPVRGRDRPPRSRGGMPGRGRQGRRAWPAGCTVTLPASVCTTRHGHRACMCSRGAGSPVTALAISPSSGSKSRSWSQVSRRPCSYASRCSASCSCIADQPVSWSSSRPSGCSGRVPLPEQDQ